MKCKDCPKCCQYVLFPLIDRDHARWAKLHGVRIFVGERTNTLKARLEIPCQMLKDGKCSIYEDRPQMCKDYFCQLAEPMTEIL